MGLTQFHLRRFDRRFMNWSLMNEYDQKGEMIMPRSMGNARDEERLQAWKEGRTGFPWIDAVMRQCESSRGPWETNMSRLVISLTVIAIELGHFRNWQ